MIALDVAAVVDEVDQVTHEHGVDEDVCNVVDQLVHITPVHGEELDTARDKNDVMDVFP